MYNVHVHVHVSAKTLGHHENAGHTCTCMFPVCGTLFVIMVANL